MLTVRSRYVNLYIPSDFFSAALLWTNVFPLYRPFKLSHACRFHIFDKTADSPYSKDISDVSVDPPDADYRFSAKVKIVFEFSRNFFPLFNWSMAGCFFWLSFVMSVPWIKIMILSSSGFF